MCGRFTRSTPIGALAELFDVPAGFDLPPSYNVAPTQLVAAVRAIPESPQRELTLLKWGLVPSWADDPKIGYKLINARSETAATKPSFRNALRHRRCLIPADGFYEWQKVETKKQPYLTGVGQGEVFALAGLWEDWERNGEVIQSCTILTTEANELMRPLHDRMPVILPPETYDRWLDPTVDVRTLQELLRPFPAEKMNARPVSIRHLATRMVGLSSAGR